MGQLVGAFAMSHQLGAPDGVEDQAERVFAGMKQIGARIRALAPDVIVVVTSDHLNNFSLGDPAPFAIGTAEQFTPLGDMGLPQDPIPGCADFAQALLAFATEQGISMAKADPVLPDHGVMIPLGIVDPQRRIPAVPLYVNTVFYPDPSPADCRALGAVVRRFIEQTELPAARVVLLAAGGLSHWVGMAGEGTVNEAWDRAFLEDIAQARVDHMAGRDSADILAVAGNGGLEIAAWITVAGAVPDMAGECLFYEAIPEWATGMAGVEWKPLT